MSAVINPVGASRRELTVLALIFGVASVVVILYAETFVSMAAIWQSSGYQHGIVVPPICAYLLWRLRGPLATAELRPCAWGIAALIPLVALWFVAEAVAVQTVEFLAAVLLIAAAVLTFLGPSLARRALFPLLFLVAAVPIGDGFLPQLMIITADVSTALLRAVDVPVFREGQFLSLPGGRFEVASVCAGLSYLTAGLFMALLFSYLTYRSWLRRAIFVGVTVVAVVLTNGVRAFVTMYVASATDMRYFAGRDHVIFGWMLFGVVVFALIYAGIRFADKPVHEAGSAVGSSAPLPPLLPLLLVFGLLMLAATAAPMFTALRNSWLVLWPATGLLLWTLYKTMDLRQVGGAASPRRGSYYRSIEGVLVLAVVPLVLALGSGLSPAPAVGEGATLYVDLPAIDGCRTGDWSEDWMPEFHLPDRQSSGAYLCSEQRVNAFVATYAGNVQDRELVSHLNRIVPDSVQSRAAFRKDGFTSTDGHVIRVNELQLDDFVSSSLVWYWYRTGDTSVTSPVVVKLRQAVDLLMMRQTESAAYVLQAPVDGVLDKSREQLTRIARALTAPEAAGAAQKVSLAKRSPQ